MHHHNQHMHDALPARDVHATARLGQRHAHAPDGDAVLAHPAGAGVPVKDDVPPLPERVPAKRRQVEALPAVHIAMWLAGDTLTPSERRRLEAEKARRRALVPEQPVGLLVGREGVTRAQMTAVLDAVRHAQPTEIHHPGVASNLHMYCKSVAPVRVHDDGGMWEVVRACSGGAVVAAPREQQIPTRKETGVWAMVAYAKHRKVAVTVVLPDGAIYTGHDGP